MLQLRGALRYIVHVNLLHEALLPAPGAFEGALDGCLGLPAENLVGLAGVGPDLLDVALAALSDLVGNLDAGGLFEGVDEAEHGASVAGAEVEDFEAGGVILAEQALEGHYVSLGQVVDVDVVADAGSVRSVVIVAEDGQLLAYAGRCLGQVWHEVLRHSVGEFADAGRRVCADGVEVAQQDAADGSAGGDDVLDYLLGDLLGGAIGGGGAFYGRGLVDGVAVGLAVDGAGGGKDDSLDSVEGHEIEEVEQSVEVVAVVEDGLVDALADGLGGGEVDDALDIGVLVEEALELAQVGDVAVEEGRALADDAGDAVEDVEAGVGEVVDDDDVEAVAHELDHGVGADIAGASGYEDFCLCHSSLNGN